MVEAGDKTYHLNKGDGYIKTVMADAFGRSNQIDTRNIYAINDMLQRKGLKEADLSTMEGDGRGNEVRDLFAAIDIDYDEFIKVNPIDVDDKIDIISRCYGIPKNIVSGKLDAVVWDALWGAVMDVYYTIMGIHKDIIEENRIESSGAVSTHTEDFQQ